jgi:hypothetical protein
MAREAAPVEAPPPAVVSTPTPPAPAPAPVAVAPVSATPVAAAPVAPAPVAPAPAEPTPVSASAPSADDATREQELAAAIAADQEALKALISAPGVPGEPPLTDSPELREIARRLPELQAELAALRERRAPSAGP